MASMQAWELLSLASCRARVRRLFSRARHSASTSNPKRSSKESAVMSAWPCWSFQAVAMAPSLRACSFSSVGAFSMRAVLPSLVVLRPTQVFMVSRHEGELRGGLGGEGQAIETVLEDGVDVPVGAGVSGTGPSAGRFQPLDAVALGKTQDAQAGAIPLLGMRAIGEDGLDQRGGLWPDGAGPVDQARGRPLEVLAVRLRHMGRIGRVPTAAIVADVRGHALAAMEDLDGGGGATGIDELVQELIGDGVVMAVDVDVVVDVDAGVDRPLAQGEGLGRERTERGLIELEEQVAPAGAIDAHNLGVERLQQVADARVEGGE